MDENYRDEKLGSNAQSRINFRLPIIIEGDDADGRSFTERTMVENVTRKGAFIETSQRLNSGALLALHDADNYEHRLCFAQVVWVRSRDGDAPGLGVKLVVDNAKWIDYLVAHSVQAADSDEAPEP